ncbi:MAG: hypothetical protein HQ557_10100 [Bacteroidetes bacterium]|nr:hypothetical protein [Bacteroidota bacterium]
MKKVVVLVLVFCIMLTSQVAGIGMENLYDMVVPLERDELAISGDLPDVLSVSLPLGGTLVADIGVEADYYSLNQTQDSFLLFDVNAAFRIGTTQTSIALGTNRNTEYRLYGFEVSSLPGFLAAGGTGSIIFASTTGASTFQFAVDPYIGVGVGRQYSIFNILRAELMMNYLGVVPTEAKVRAVTEVFTQAAVILNTYSDNDAELVTEYWSRLASAMGIPNRVLDIIAVSSSQEYAFELNRYAGLMSGMEAMLYLSLEPELNTNLTPPFSIGGDVGMSGAINGVFINDVLYYEADGSIAAGFSSGSFSALLALNGNLVYLPEDYHWWAEAGLNAGLNIGTTTNFSVILTGDVYYMLNPNFTTYAEVSLSTSSIGIKAGGAYRLW